MSTSKKINVSHAFHQRLNQETTRLKLSYKEYLEAAGEFFIAHKIDPRKYQAGQTEELANLLRSAVDRIFALLIFQEQHVLKAIHTEASKARIMGELSVNHLLRLLTEDESSLQALQQQDQQYLTQRLRQALDQLETAKTQ
ncbi:BfmA/BtgA family mobilization protein [Tunicatimonas pelagia]|uniref:BfmA/BtgA family mobilization protein n=1 Tax=Tunicatimonas pelagia TaxID=931531 RepID=UPI0026660D40|nr:BfmA/BtgA family mobilization protein [Tunicatimonas pelagia]WKN43282.1 BfmA/BtgA family mobilization protein [Tunicatimonas pelagia]